VVSRDSIACDSSALISLTDSCFLQVLYELKEESCGSFVITPRVRYESIEHPMKIREYAMAALRLLKAEGDGVIETMRANVAEETEEFLRLSNNLFVLKGRPLKLVQSGEAEVLALAKELGLENILIDERTTRMLAEAPLDLKAHMEKEFGEEIEVNGKNLERLEEYTRGISAFRSSELVALAFEKGFFRKYGEMEREALEAALYAVKFAGCGVSFAEIDEFMAGVKK